jgi:hypothetical protein
MPQSLLEQLQSIDPQTLAEVVRQDQRSPAFEISEWNVDYLSHKGIVNPEGLFLFSGVGHDSEGSRPWSVVLKVLRKPDYEQDPRDIWYWKRELLAAQHDLLPQHEGPLSAPGIYAVMEYEDSGWIWMEHIVEKSRQPWTLEDYAFAAHALGYANGLSLMAAPSPDYPWLCTEHCRWWLRLIEGREPEKAWENPYVSKYFPHNLRAGWEQLWSERETFLTALSKVPQHFSHFDTTRHNLMLREKADRNLELVAIDWAFVGNGALGGDLYALLGSSFMLFVIDHKDWPDLEPAATQAYFKGLSDAGWRGNPDLARLGYTAWFALWAGCAAPAVTSVWTSRPVERLLQLFNRGPEECAAGWASALEFALVRADEARRLMAKLAL